MSASSSASAASAPRATVAAAGPIRVLIVEDHQMVAEGLAMGLAIAEDVDVVGIASTVEDALTLAGSTRPDVALVDYRLPDGDGLDLTARLAVIAGGPAMVMVTSYLDGALARAALDAGCRGFVVKHSGFEEVLRAIRAVHAGEVHVSGAVLNELLPGRRGTPAPDLTARELEVLGFLAEGLSTADIAARLFLSVNTIRNHVQNVLSKLGAGSRLEAVALGVRAGLVRRG